LRKEENSISFHPFDQESLDLLANTFDLPFIKIPSGEITNAPFLLDIARTHKPVILSTGMSTLGEIEQALGVLAFGYIAALKRQTQVHLRKPMSLRKDAGR